MRKISKLIRAMLLVVVTGFISYITAAEAADCSGPWKRLRGYEGGSGGACAQLGLNSHQGTCQPGQAYETLCDDRAGGEYRICQGPNRCRPPRHHRDDYDRRDWGPGDRHHPSPDGPPGGPDCRYWDFHYRQPCPPGFMNLDCRGGCERM